ncbi:MAG: virulence protein [Anaerovoracaceae bacterium]
MKLTFNVTKENKKIFAKTISAITGDKAVYQFTPTYAFKIGDLTVNRDATLTAPDGKDLTALLTALKAEGYVVTGTEKEDAAVKTAGDPAEDATPAESTEQPEETAENSPAEPEPADDGVTGLTIAMPLDSANVGTLTNLLSSKGELIKHALGITDTGINVTEDKIEFPWFDRALTADESNAYMLFITALCRLSKELKRASGRPTETDNEKYAFRCFLLRLGFIGPEYKGARKILLKNLTGSAAFRNGSRNAG